MPDTFKMYLASFTDVDYFVILFPIEATYQRILLYYIAIRYCPGKLLYGQVLKPTWEILLYTIN